MTVSKYLDHIGVADVGTDYKALCILQLAHYRAVPYENFDILLERPLSLEPEALYRKIVEEERGGYCFELNGLYAWLLRGLGFSLTERLGRFLRDGDPETIPKGRHRILLTECEGERVICDVGIGSKAPMQPVKLVYDQIQMQPDGVNYRVVRHPVLHNLLEFFHKGAWEPYFSFGDEENYPCDFEAISFFCEHSPASFFNKGCMANLFTETGRNSLDGQTFKQFSGETVTVEEISDPKRFGEFLEERLHLGRLPESDVMKLIKAVENR